jgi:hypothetical protein
VTVAVEDIVGLEEYVGVRETRLGAAGVTVIRVEAGSATNAVRSEETAV